MAYTYEQVFAADPSNPSNVAQNASITIFAPGDGTMTPLTITDPDGQPLANPIPVNANGFGSAFAHATLDRVAWAGGGFTGFFTSYEGMKGEAVAAREAAETAAAEAATAAQADLEARIAAGQFKGADGAPGTNGINGVNGSNVLPTDTAIKDAIENPASATRGALATTIREEAVRPAGPRPARPLVVFTFDDAPSQDWTVIKPILDAKGIKGSFAAISGTVGNGSTLTWPQILQLQAEGHEIINHSATHADLNTTDPAIIAAEIDASHATFVSRGVVPVGFCWPYASSNKTTRDAVRKHYKYALGGSGGTTQPLHTYAIKRASIGSSSDLASRTALIDAAITNNELLIFLIHSGYDLDAVGQTVLGQVIDYAKASAADVVTAAEAFDLVGNVVDVGDLPGGVDYTVVAGGGKFASSNPGVVVIGANNPSVTATPISYAGGKVTIQAVYSPQNDGWPGATAATVYTDRTQTSDPVFTKQTLYAGTGNVYTRYGASTTTWSAWAQLSGWISKRGSLITGAEAAPSTYEDGKITVSAVSAAATGWPTTGMPANLTTDRTESSNYAYVWQRYAASNGKEWTRRAVDASTWGAWQMVAAQNVTGSNTPAITDNVSMFPIGSSLTVISTAVGPGSTTGTLETHRPSSSSPAYAVQNFHVYNGTASYRRMANTDGTWKAWQTITT